jgi:hypothetical protein
VEIKQCSVESGCDDEWTCYLYPGAPCVDVIDEWGNASVATSVSIDIMDCAKRNGCR